MNTIRKKLSTIICSLAIIAVATMGISCDSNTSGSSTKTYTVVMKNNQFEPKAISVVQGEVVSFQNSDGETHTATADNGVWTTGDISAGAHMNITFKTVGTYEYHCRYHQNEGMKGTITVTSDGSY